MRRRMADRANGHELIIWILHDFPRTHFIELVRFLLCPMLVYTLDFPSQRIGPAL